MITAEKVTRVLGIFTEQYDYIVLDLPHDFSETTLAGLDVAEQILMVLTPELAAVRAMSTVLDAFAHLDYPRERLAPLLNTTFERGALARKDIEAALKQPIALTLPFASDALISAINRGIPPVVDLATKPIGAALEDCTFFASRETDRTQRPAKPTEAWQRLAHRTQQRRLRAS